MLVFWFHLYARSWMIVVSKLMRILFFAEPSNRPQVNIYKQQRKKKKRMKKWKQEFFSFFRAIRIRTVDLLGKRAQTDYYQNDSNFFKDPTCIFLHWAHSLTDRKNQLVYHNSLDIKITRWLYVLGFIDSDPRALPKCFKEGYLDVGLLLT